MFAQIPVAALSDHRLSLIDSRVLAALYSFASASNPVCWPSRAAISERCGYCPETISRAVTRLKRFGWIVRTVALRGCQRYILRGVTGSVTARGDGIGHTEQTQPEQTTIPPTPEPVESSEKSIELDASESAHDEAVAVIVALIAASGARYSTKPRSGPVRAAEKALKAGYTVEQLRLVIAFCAATWSNPRFLTPSAVLKLSRLDERIAAAQAQAPASSRAACHRPFEREPEPERADPGVVAGHLRRLKAALVA